VLFVGLASGKFSVQYIGSKKSVAIDMNERFNLLINRIIIQISWFIEKPEHLELNNSYLFLISNNTLHKSQNLTILLILGPQ
jgi:hypothetical protein